MALLQASSVELCEGARLDRDELLARLAGMGYQRTAMVEERGELALRGAIVDAFSPQEPYPLRMEFMDESVCSIRYFNPSSQRSLRALTRATFLPAREIVLDEESRLRGARALEAKGREAGLEEAHLSYFLERLEEEGFFPGIEGMLPLFLGELESLFQHLPRDAVVVVDEPQEVAEEERKLWESLEEEAELAPGRGLVSFDPELFWLKAEAIYALAERLPLLLFDSLPLYPQEREASLELRAETLPPMKGRLSAFAEQLKSWRRSGAGVVLVSPDRTRAIRLKGLLGDYELGVALLEEGSPIRAEEVELAIAIGSVSSSFSLKEPDFVLFREEDLFIAAMGAPRRIAPTRKLRPSLGELREGDFVVHSEYGIALYRGLCSLDWGGGEGEFLLLEYAGGDRLYVPTERAHLVQRYLASGDLNPRLDKLGGTAWARVKRRVKESLRSMAEELLKLYAKRKTVKGHAFSADDDLSREFELGFEYEETPDQLQAIQEAKADMEQPRPMDRLVCGDVGYGKTEVAMRASFKAVMDGKQAAMLVPTTILAQQHYATFKKRFEPFPVRVEVLSRFRSRAEQREVLEGLRTGLVDIVIGTHRLLQKDVSFANLGLLIIDEEHRFGVRHKEKLKSLRASVDVLTLTATPIPRTLHLSLLGIRDLSIIETPPKERLAVRTYICRFSAKDIREAIERELARGGQVFFV
ncbi:MAG: DEAD/DEAH box helicase, partial [Nitrospinota bacterium]